MQPQVTAEQLIEATLKHAENFDIEFWARKESLDDDDGFVVSKFGECGYVACLAGNTCLIAGDKLVRKGGEGEGDVYAVDGDGNSEHVFDRAVELLGISEEEARGLFRKQDWPNGFKRRYNESESNLERAEVACDVVKYFLVEGGE